ncbi:MAG: phospholipid carrier-dependent glycosyltransferase [Chitinivibrionales bacterium]|nr:phospholipid carrier-dependent glycosyltransferase [Chitinivibrionales bacterium]
MLIIVSIRTHRNFWIFLAAITLIRVFYGSWLGLGDDEAYYWEWGRHLALSYFDHPPLTSWIGRLTCEIFGNTEFGFRFGAMASSTIFLIILYTLSLMVFTNRSIAFTTVVFVSAIPLFAIGGFMMVPDAFLALFWLLAIFFFWKIVKNTKAADWYFLGAIFGFGLLSKYNMVVLPLCVLMFLLISKEHRFWLKRKEPWLACCIGILIFTPVLYWNWSRGFPSFAFHLIDRNAGRSWSWRPFQLYLSGQLGYLSPLVFIGSLVAMGVGLYQGIKHKKLEMLFLSSMSIPYVFFFSLACSISPTTKPHWPAMGYIASFLIMTKLFHEYKTKNTVRHKKTITGYGYTAFGLSLLFTVLLHAQALYPFAQSLMPAVRMIAPDAKIKPKEDVTGELYGWPKAAEEISRQVDLLREQTDKPVFLFAPRYNIASQVAFYTNEHYQVISISGSPEQFDLWGRGSLEGKEGHHGLFIADNRFNHDPARHYHFERIEKVPALTVTRAGFPARTFYLYRCFNYQGRKQ